MNRLPSLFISHGAPTFALEPGAAGAQLTALGHELPRPKAVLVVSPHWMTDEPRVASSPKPQTIHDFRGFGAALLDITYPADGHPALAARTVEILRAAGWPATADQERGLDHGAWVPLLHLYPKADVPVFQVSMPTSLVAATAFEFGRTLAPLVSEGVLIVGSGSLTHNLHALRFGMAKDEPSAEFARWVRDSIARGDRERMLRALEIGPHARRAHPTPEHYLPLPIAAGAAPDDESEVIEGGTTYGVLAMDSFVFGGTRDRLG
jgi:4,5-DOPA dioxygenase extradiol